MADLTLVTTDDLLAELESRYRLMVFVAEEPCNSTKEYRSKIWYNGSYIEMLGLVDMIKYRMLVERENTLTEEEDGNAKL